MAALYVIIISKKESHNVTDNMYIICETHKEKAGFYLANSHLHLYKNSHFFFKIYPVWRLQTTKVIYILKNHQLHKTSIHLTYEMFVFHSKTIPLLWTRSPSHQDFVPTMFASLSCINCSASTKLTPISIPIGCYFYPNFKNLSPPAIS